MIILDEKAYAESLIKNGSQSSYPKVKDITFLAKYYYYIGLGTHEIKSKLKEYCFKTDKNFNMVINGWKIKSAINTAKRYKLKTIFPIMVTKVEVEIIKQWEDYEKQRILFVLLVYAKFLKYSNTRIKSTRKTYMIGEFYVNETMSNIVRVAKVSMRKKERNKFFNELHDRGMFDYTFHDSLLIKYVDENSDPEIIVEDFTDITLYWARYCGERIAACSKCRKLFLQRTNMQQKCRKCWKEEKKEKVRIAVMKNYYRKKEKIDE